MNSTMDSAVNSPVEKSVAVQSMFDRIAGTYDVLNSCISLGLHHHWKNKAVRSLELQPGHHALDVCTGTGDLIDRLVKTVGPQGQVTGLDFSSQMLAVAKQRFQSNPQVQLIQGDAMALPFEDNQFDGAIVAFGLRNVNGIDGALAELTRVVKPGGRVVNLDTCPNPSLPGFKWYFSTVMPWIGQRLSADPTAYRYLFESTEAFISAPEMAKRFQKAGLTSAHSQTLSFGAVMLQSGIKPLT